jgi:flavin reductase (DIM6/NTAB) family NADH-FMN oxidoreductase RutF
MTCSSVVSVSLKPPLVLFCPAKSSTTWPVMRAADHFAVNVLGGGAVAVARRFARRGEERFAGTSWRAGQTGSPLLGDAIAWIECRTTARHDGGDHEIVIGEVVAVETQAGEPLVFHDGELFALSAVRAAT